MILCVASWQLKEAKAREGALVGEKSKCKGPEVGKQTAHVRSKRKTAEAETLGGR